MKLGSLLDDRDHAAAQLKKHLLLLACQIVVIRTFMDQCITGVLSSASEVIQRSTKNLGNVIQQVKAGFSCTTFNMTDGLDSYANLFSKLLVLISFALRAERILWPIRIALISIVFAPFSFISISIDRNIGQMNEQEGSVCLSESNPLKNEQIGIIYQCDNFLIENVTNVKRFGCKIVLYVI